MTTPTADSSVSPAPGAAVPEIRMVLVETSHPGNIGAAARAMKNMGLESMHLVAPGPFPHPEANARASGADDILERARVYERLGDALSDCVLVFATSARVRGLAWPQCEPREAARLAWEAADQGPVSFVFGPERIGLRNDEIGCSHYQVVIPTAPGFSSLNLAAAVQIIGYELYRAHAEVVPAPIAEAPCPGQGELEQLYEHWWQVLVAVEFVDPEHPRHVMQRLRRMIQRARLDRNELNILRGFLRAVQERLRP